MTIELTIDGRKVEAREGESLLEVARRAGAEIPSLCHHPMISPYGACRLCLVEVTKGGRTKITTSCNYEVQAGIEVRTDTEAVRRHRKVVLELILPMAPDSTRVKGLARAHGIDTARFESKAVEGRPKDCILCGLCARVCEEVTGACALSLTARGDRRRLEPPFGERVAASCVACGACAAVCPTGAVEMESAAIDALRKRPATKRPCRYALMGMMPGALCPNDYDCALCEVDQRFVAACAPHHPVFAAKGRFVPAAWEETEE